MVTELNYHLYRNYNFKISKKLSSASEVAQNLTRQGIDFKYIKINTKEEYCFNQVPDFFFTSLIFKEQEIYGEVIRKKGMVIFRNKYSKRRFNEEKFKEVWSGNILYFGDKVKTEYNLRKFMSIYRYDLLVLVLFIPLYNGPWIFFLLGGYSVVYFFIMKYLLAEEENVVSSRKFCKDSACLSTSKYFIYKNITFADLGFLHSVLCCLTAFSFISFNSDINFLLLSFLVLGLISIPFLFFSVIFQIRKGVCWKCFLVILINFFILGTSFFGFISYKVNLTENTFSFWILLMGASFLISFLFKKSAEIREELKDLRLENLNITRSMDGKFLKNFLMNTSFFYPAELENKNFQNFSKKEIILISDVGCDLCREYLKWLLPFLKKHRDVNFIFLLRRPKKIENSSISRYLMSLFFTLSSDNFLKKLNEYSEGKKEVNGFFDSVSDRFLLNSEKIIDANKIELVPALFIDSMKVQDIYSKQIFDNVLAEYLES